MAATKSASPVFVVKAKRAPVRVLQEFTLPEIQEMLTELAYDGVLDGIPRDDEEVVVELVK